MKRELLTIKQLSKTGHALRTVSCRAGQITVFRAQVASDLKPYQLALAGINGAERFVIELDNGPFESHEHVLIGFGEGFREEDGLVKEYLATAEMPAGLADSLMNDFDLVGSRDKSCTSLSPAEGRLLRILHGAHSPSKVLVLNDPFELLLSQWRERIADLLVTQARQSNQIVVVSALSQRPSSWIDNELIVRVQVGETRQRTIGFSSAPSEVQEEITRLRESMQRASVAAPAAALMAPSLTSVKGASEIGESAKESAPFLKKVALVLNNPAAIYSFGFVALMGVAGVVWSLRAPEGSITSAAAPQPTAAEMALPPPPVVPVVVAPEVLPPPPVQPEAIAAVVPAVEALPPPPPPSDRILDEYPGEIKLAVMHAFEGKNVAIPITDSAPCEEPALVKSAGHSSDLLMMLESASSTENTGSSPSSDSYIAEAPPPMMDPEESPDEENWEQRREMMRQKFLESIQAASGG